MAHTIRKKKKLIARVRRIAGQIEAVERALETETECADVLQLIASVRGAVNGLMAEVMEDHVRERHEFRERAAMLMAAGALREAWLDNAESARLQARAAVNLVPGKGVRALAALALARAGDAATAGKLANQLAAEFPSSALIQYYWLPAIRAQVELRNGHYSQTIELLQAAAPYDLADTPAPMTPVYIRAEALLGARLGNAAATEFQRILDHRGIVGNSPLGALARLGSARAYALSGDVAKAGSQYREFLSLWKEADAVVPAFKQANAELLKLK